ncbi:DUF3822 family protein [Chryseobacterium gossypii]|uniref:DUF3822 family protein n=1 Tax=Chryseobacterium gossypii TaxID=3231602 RepID=UPI0035260D58
MNVLNLLFTKDGLIYQIARNKSILEEKSYFVTEESPENFIADELEKVLIKQRFDEISVVSALNHFTLMPEGFSEHEAGFDLIAFNAPVDKEKEELMLSINRKYKVQFYYTFPKNYYRKIKDLAIPVHFNFSGEKFLNSIHTKNNKEIHINLYHNQCEFLAIDNKQIILYNNLDVNSEVDFLYFIMFTLSKIGFGINDTNFFAYGETTENETFLSELQKFVKHLKIVYDNIPNKNFILNQVG